MWDHVIEPNEIRRMSRGCEHEAGNAVTWASLISATYFQCSVILNRGKGLSCHDREGSLNIDVKITGQKKYTISKVSLEIELKIVSFIIRSLNSG